MSLRVPIVAVGVKGVKADVVADVEYELDVGIDIDVDISDNVDDTGGAESLEDFSFFSFMEGSASVRDERNAHDDQVWFVLGV